MKKSDFISGKIFKSLAIGGKKLADVLEMTAKQTVKLPGFVALKMG